MRKLLTALALTVSITVAACGGGTIDNDKAEKIRDRAAEIQQDAQQTAEDVRTGTQDAEVAAKAVEADMNELANEAIDAAKDVDMPAEMREQLEAAQDELNGRE